MGPELEIGQNFSKTKCALIAMTKMDVSSVSCDDVDEVNFLVE